MGSAKAMLWGFRCTSFHIIFLTENPRNTAIFLKGDATGWNGSFSDCGSGCRRFKSDHSPQSPDIHELSKTIIIAGFAIGLAASDSWAADTPGVTPPVEIVRIGHRCRSCRQRRYRVSEYPFPRLFLRYAWPHARRQQNAIATIRNGQSPWWAMIWAPSARSTEANHRAVEAPTGSAIRRSRISNTRRRR
jgi:hypothetical protein